MCQQTVKVSRLQEHNNNNNNNLPCRRALRSASTSRLVAPSFKLFTLLLPSRDIWSFDWHRYSGPCSYVRYLSQSTNLCLLTYLPPKICVHPPRRSALFHDCALAKEYALSSTTLVVMEVCLSHFRVACRPMWHGTLHARCAIVEPTITMRVQIYVYLLTYRRKFASIRHGGSAATQVAA